MAWEGFGIAASWRQRRSRRIPGRTASWYEDVHLDVVRGYDEKLPVIVYFHGDLIVGPSHLMLRGFQLTEAMNAVYVSINFRLGALCYLDLRSFDDCVGNPAVMDRYYYSGYRKISPHLVAI